MSRESVVLSWSGGKDSALALASLQADPRYDVVALLTSITRDYDRVSIHGVRRALVDAQASMLGLPLYEIALQSACSNDAYEAAFLEAVARVRAEHPGVRHLAFGDLFLADVRAYRERLVGVAGCSALFPLWGGSTTELATEFIAAGFRATLVCVDTLQLPASFVGRDFTVDLLAELPATVDPCGERGEFHTFVWAGPIFTEPIALQLGEIVLRDERFAFWDLVPTSPAPIGS